MGIDNSWAEGIIVNIHKNTEGVFIASKAMDTPSVKMT